LLQTELPEVRSDNTQADRLMQVKPNPDFIFEISLGFRVIFLVFSGVVCVWF